MVRFGRGRLPPQRVVVWQDTAPSQQRDQDAEDVVPNALARLPLISWRRRAAGVAAFSHGRSMPDGIPLQMGRTTMPDGIPCDAVRGWGVGDADRVCHRELYDWAAMVYGKSSCRFTSAEPTPPHTPTHTHTHAHVYPESASQNEGGKRTSSMLAAHQRALQTRTRSTGTRRGAARAHVRTKPAVAVEYRIPSVHPSGRGVRVQAVAQRDRGGDGRPGLVGRQGASRGHHAAHAGAHRSQRANKTATPAGTTCRMRSSTARAARQSGAVRELHAAPRRADHADRASASLAFLCAQRTRLCGVRVRVRRWGSTRRRCTRASRSWRRRESAGFSPGTGSPWEKGKGYCTSCESPRPSRPSGTTRRRCATCRS